MKHFFLFCTLFLCGCLKLGGHSKQNATTQCAAKTVNKTEIKPDENNYIYLPTRFNISKFRKDGVSYDIFDWDGGLLQYIMDKGRHPVTGRPINGKILLSKPQDGSFKTIEINPRPNEPKYGDLIDVIGPDETRNKLYSIWELETLYQGWDKIVYFPREPGFTPDPSELKEFVKITEGEETRYYKVVKLTEGWLESIRNDFGKIKNPYTTQYVDNVAVSFPTGNGNFEYRIFKGTEAVEVIPGGNPAEDSRRMYLFPNLANALDVGTVDEIGENLTDPVSRITIPGGADYIVQPPPDPSPIWKDRVGAVVFLNVPGAVTVSLLTSHFVQKAKKNSLCQESDDGCYLETCGFTEGITYRNAICEGGYGRLARSNSIEAFVKNACNQVTNERGVLFCKSPNLSVNPYHPGEKVETTEYWNVTDEKFVENRRVLSGFDVNINKYTSIFTEGEGDTTISVFDEAGKFITANDDAVGGNTNAKVSLPKGRYLIVVGSFHSTPISYTLKAEGL